MSNLQQSPRQTGAEVDLAPSASELHTYTSAAQTALLSSGETYWRALRARYPDGLKTRIDLTNAFSKMCTKSSDFL